MTPALTASRLRLADRLEPTELRVEHPTLVCVIGPNGSGKTSLLHALAGIGGAEGQVEVHGRVPAALSVAERPRLFAYLPASREVPWPLSARDLVALGGATEAEGAAALRELELEAFAHRRVDRLSTGERSRILVARALAPKPRLLLLDEPTANLDPLWQLRLMARLSVLTAEEKVVALVAMHDLDLAARHADRLLLMDRGRIVADGPPGEVLGSGKLRQVFGIERVEGLWQPVSRPEDRRSSP
jgi:iron complex transport system ATP-binding protein